MKRYKVTFGVHYEPYAAYQADIFTDQPDHYSTAVGAELYADRKLKAYRDRGDRRPWFAQVWCIEPDGPTGAKATVIKDVELAT